MLTFVLWPIQNLFAENPAQTIPLVVKSLDMTMYPNLLYSGLGKIKTLRPVGAMYIRCDLPSWTDKLGRPETF